MHFLWFMGSGFVDLGLQISLRQAHMDRVKPLDLPGLHLEFRR